ncbi:MAG: histidine phosphatase family protein [Polyangiaceae bacterium]
MSVALFIRHGKASAFAGDYDQLSPPGFEQSEQLGKWLAQQKLRVDAVFVGPRKRHAQTHETVMRVLGTHGRSLPEPRFLPELDEHDGLSVVYKLLPELAAGDHALRSIVEATVKGVPPSSDDVLSAFKRVTRRWVRGEVGHSDVEPWAAFRARVGRALPQIASIGRGKTALVFTSAGAVASAVADAMGVTEEEKVLALSWSLFNGSVTELDFADGRWGLRSFNGTAHLERRLVTSV